MAGVGCISASHSYPVGVASLQRSTGVCSSSLHIEEEEDRAVAVEKRGNGGKWLTQEICYS